MSDVIADAYARASEVLAVPLSRVPDGCLLVGAMDGWTTTVPALDAELARVDRTQRREPAED
ncbi:hypothetical protein E6C67_14220 [Azospirillum sp. TSA2s]|uniref:hypothetical protein n=1 Tax=Azospirillum sp. TSA2s TaxID=709810 RepID=UPI0010A9B9B9|nr:hypothetical protein [Azospirillum sp. TSA2s]QCG94984.1 hypothetical protein E6C67_14220 [Azospirillum sp. TSA2s]